MSDKPSGHWGRKLLRTFERSPAALMTRQPTSAVSHNSSVRLTRSVRRRAASFKRYDSIGSAPAGIVGVGSTLFPGHFRLGRLDEAAGVCGGRGPSMGFELGSNACVDRTDQIKSRMGGFVQTAFWEV